MTADLWSRFVVAVIKWISSLEREKDSSRHCPPKVYENKTLRDRSKTFLSSPQEEGRWPLAVIAFHGELRKLQFTTPPATLRRFADRCTNLAALWLRLIQHPSVSFSQTAGSSVLLSNYTARMCTFAKSVSTDPSQPQMHEVHVGNLEVICKGADHLWCTHPSLVIRVQLIFAECIAAVSAFPLWKYVSWGWFVLNFPCKERKSLSMQCRSNVSLYLQIATMVFKDSTEDLPAWRAMKCWLLWGDFYLLGRGLSTTLSHQYFLLALYGHLCTSPLHHFKGNCLWAHTTSSSPSSSRSTLIKTLYGWSFPWPNS